MFHFVVQISVWLWRQMGHCMCFMFLCVKRFQTSFCILNIVNMFWDWFKIIKFWGIFFSFLQIFQNSPHIRDTRGITPLAILSVPNATGCITDTTTCLATGKSVKEPSVWHVPCVGKCSTVEITTGVTWSTGTMFLTHDGRLPQNLFSGLHIMYCSLDIIGFVNILLPTPFQYWSVYWQIWL